MEGTSGQEMCRILFWLIYTIKEIVTDCRKCENGGELKYGITT